MWRRIHSLLGLVGLVLVLALSLSGAALSVFPVAEGLAATSQPLSGLTVAGLVGRVLPSTPGLKSLTRTASGQIVAGYSDADGSPHQGFVDVATGRITGDVPQNGPVYEVLKDLHRSFLLGESGRMVAGGGAALMAILSISGVLLLVARMGGVARLLDRPKGSFAGRLHTILTRMALVPFVLSSLTGLYITLTEFEIIPVTEAETSLFPESSQGLPAVAAGSLHGLAEIPAADLRSLTFPFAGDTFDIFTVKSTSGLTLVDQFTGDVLEQVPATTAQIIFEWFFALHTGEGLAWIGAVLGLAALTAPVIAFAGVVIWWQRTRENRVRVAHNHAPKTAEIVILVGSEGGSTWGFARALHRELTRAGQKVHLAPMNSFRNQYDRARQVLFLASTYGNGGVPASASGIVQRLAMTTQIPTWSFAVLGFGDRAFPKYCQFAKDLDHMMLDRGWRQLLPNVMINRQSTQAFFAWGEQLGQALGLPLTLDHKVQLPPTVRLRLVEREVYGTEVQVPTAVLRLQTVDPKSGSFWQRLARFLGMGPQFSPGALLGVVAPDSVVPRYYSIASAASHSEVEICVRKIPGGVCSGLLHGLAIGDEIEGFAMANSEFVPVAGRRPIIMVGAGSGIAPLVGAIRSNTRHRPIHLFFGGRDPASDFLYQSTLAESLTSNRLATLATAFSRVRGGAYVQDKVRGEAGRLAELLRQGASVMVCGGDAMASAVRAEFDAILGSIGQSVDQMKTRGQYLEDIF